MQVPWWYTSLLALNSSSEVFKWYSTYNCEVVHVLYYVEPLLGRKAVIQWMMDNWVWIKDHVTVIPDRLDGGVYISGPEWWSSEYYFYLDTSNPIGKEDISLHDKIIYEQKRST